MLWGSIDISWQAVGAVATILAAVAMFCAVFVALLPLWRDAKHREKTARNLRWRIWHSATGCHRMVAAGRKQGWPIQREILQQCAESLEKFLPEAALLDAAENDALNVTIATLGTLSIGGSGARLHRDALRVLDELRMALDDGRMFRAAPPEPDEELPAGGDEGSE